LAHQVCRFKVIAGCVAVAGQYRMATVVKAQWQLIAEQVVAAKAALAGQV
jgi:hypothetical protein